MRAVLLTGVPGTGKTTLMKRLINRLGGVGEFSLIKSEETKLLTTMYHEKLDISIIGSYDPDSDEVFQGTDKLSMAVQPDFEKWIAEKSPVFVCEGDRLVNNKAIDFLIEKGYDVKIVALEVDKDVLKSRYEHRGSDQNEQFIRSRYTKVDNIINRLDLSMFDMIAITPHLTQDDTETICKNIENFLLDAEDNFE